jgi:hypothetical protein
MNGLDNMMGRKVGLSNASPERFTGLRAMAESLSLKNVDQATCELMNEALSRLVLLAYEVDGGGYCNIDEATGKLLIVAPWGRNGYARWGLKPQEANILRQILFDWAQPGPSLLQYDRTRRAWFVNLRDFANIHLAKRWMTHHQISVGLYRAARAKRIAGA